MSMLSEGLKGRSVEELRDAIGWASLKYTAGGTFTLQAKINANDDINYIQSHCVGPSEFCKVIAHYLAERPAMIQWHKDKGDIPPKLPSNMSAEDMCAIMYTNMTIAVQDAWVALHKAGFTAEDDGIDVILHEMSWDEVSLALAIPKSMPQARQDLARKTMENAGDGSQIMESSGKSRLASPSEIMELAGMELPKDIISALDKFLENHRDELQEIVEMMVLDKSDDRTIEAQFEDLESDCVMPSEIPEA